MSSRCIRQSSTRLLGACEVQNEAKSLVELCSLAGPLFVVKGIPQVSSFSLFTMWLKPVFGGKCDLDRWLDCQNGAMPKTSQDHIKQHTAKRPTTCETPYFISLANIRSKPRLWLDCDSETTFLEAERPLKTSSIFFSFFDIHYMTVYLICAHVCTP